MSNANTDSRIVLGNRANVLRNIEPCPMFSVRTNIKGNQKKVVNRGRWSKEEDSELKRLVEEVGDTSPTGQIDWSTVASHFPDRNDVQCQQRWCKVLNPSLIKGPWTQAVSA